MRILFVFFVLISHTSGAQFLIRGKILDSSDKKPLPYAYVELQKDGTATASNNEGYFEIKSGNSEAQLVISCLGYETKIVNLTLDKTEKDELIYLIPKVFTLDEVVVAPEKIENLIKAIYNKYKERKDEIYIADAFYRDYATVDDLTATASEIFYKVRINQSGIGDWNFIQGRSAESKIVVEKPSADYLFTSFLNTSAFMRKFPVTDYTPESLNNTFYRYCISPICENPGHHYKYKRIGEKVIDDKNVAVITFSPNRKDGKYKFSGKFEVIEDDLQIIYMELELNKWQFFYAIANYPGKYERKQNIDSCYLKHAWYYKKSENDWKLERIENSLTLRVRYAGDPTYKKMNRHTSGIYFTNYRVPDSSKLKKQVIKEDDKRLIRDNIYDPHFWKNNSAIISEIPFEQRIKKSLMENGFYGNLFPGGVESPHYSQCSDLENRVIGSINANYFRVFNLLVAAYFF